MSQIKNFHIEELNMDTGSEVRSRPKANKASIIKPERVLVTLPYELADADACLLLLRTILQRSANTAFLTNLRKAAWELSYLEPFEASQKLSKEFASFRMLGELEHYSAKGQVPLLFNHPALKLIDILLRFSFDVPPTRDPVQEAYGSESFQFGGFNVISQNLWKILQTFEGIFLLANTLVAAIQNSDLKPEINENSVNIRRFYERYSIDGVSAVARAEIYRHAEFRHRFLQAFNLDLDEFLESVFGQLAHYISNSKANLSAHGEFPELAPAHRDFFKAQLERLATPIGTLMEEVSLQTLRDLSVTDQERLQRPFVCIESRYFCFDNTLLYNAFSELPYYLLLDACNRKHSEVKRLGKLYGDQMEEFYRHHTARALGHHVLEDYVTKNRHKDLDLQAGHRIGDILVTLTGNTRLLVETKGAAPTNQIKLGSLSEFQKSFLCKSNEHKGVGQIVRDIKVFRRETGYDGKFYSILLFRGPIPPGSGFNEMVETFLSGNADYQTHRGDRNNCPVIWLDRDSFELLLSGFSQGVSPTGVLEELSLAPPSEARRIIWETLLKEGVRPSNAPLFHEEIQRQASRSRSLFKKE